MVKVLKAMVRTAGIAVGAVGVAAVTAASYAGDLAASATNHLIRDKVGEPAVGSVVRRYHGGLEHTGIYVGNNQIIHWSENSRVEKCNPEAFLQGGGDLALSIYVSCKGTEPIGSLEVAQRARVQVGHGIDERGPYDPLVNNSHRFVIECLSGQECQEDLLVKDPIEYCKVFLGADNWRVWERD
ncbi:hypothetical protein NHP190012_08590 [Helicobacter sp. NHP19-012]|uniref:Uncharacterized protein n=1 Tax=Helicobacter gastrofelis TaxID=2849642 RepID=A0ABM7SEK9_9HELI|nr:MULTISPECIES: lecithin retinol acyltransferase family protein [unclassified Helicobacter]BCZ19217.1 hypothetical protein NHP190012_08590 [Helicobacter sp. NHP19-012]GMB95995.1 hypothetical protein NHP22001_05840 [Helicobacter sp. NHP22-001]